MLLHVSESHKLAADRFIFTPRAEVVSVLSATAVLIDAEGMLENVKLTLRHLGSGISSQIRPSNRRPAQALPILSE